jgi:4-amino-4-deoxy-L-arabinose transferase-like glycosyltransferase
MGAFPVSLRRPAGVAASRAASVAAARLSLALVCVVAVVLRFWEFPHIASDPFYDAAVRSMGQSWHNLLYGAFEPGGSVAVDKPPVDLWLQVASTKIFGFSSMSVRLPEAIAGTLAVPLLYDLVRRAFGRVAGLVAAAALAVLPVAVLTSRSDTMDTLMGTLLLAAAWVIVAARPERRARAVVAAGAIAGLAFEVKIFQSVVVLPALAVLAWRSLDAPADERKRILRRAGGAWLAVAAAWPVVASLLPGRHPWPIGSHDGQIWNVVLVFNGVERLAPGSGAGAPVGPSPWRLFTPGFMGTIGVELLAALALGGLALLVARRSGAGPPPLSRLQRATAAGLGCWLLIGFAFFSIQGWVRVRYLEAFSPAVAAVIGVGLTYLVGTVARRRGWSPARRGVAVALAAAAILAVPLVGSAQIARSGARDSQTLGAMPAAQVESLHRYLAAHQNGVRYELAASRTTIAAPLIVRDGRPVLMLTSWMGRPLGSAADFAAKVRAGQVRHLLLDETGCAVHAAASCSPAARWGIAHGTDVSRAAGLGPGLVLLRLG